MNVNTVIYKFQTSFFIYTPAPLVRECIMEYLEELTKYEDVTEFTVCPVTGKKNRFKHRVATQKYYTRSVCGSNFGLLKADYKPLMAHLCYRGINIETFTVKEVKLKPAITAEIPLKHWVKPRDNQVEAMQFLLEKDKPIRVVHAATGFGKTFLGIVTASSHGYRAGYMMQPAHIKTWEASFEQFTTLDKDDFYCISGGESIRKAIGMVKEGTFNYRVVMISAVTYREYIKEFETARPEDFSYDATPIELWGLLGLGTLVLDEAHESLKALVRSTIYCTVKNLIYLSATLVSDDPRANKIYEKIFPILDRYVSEPNKYHVVHPIGYYMSKVIKTKGPMGYSHIKFEAAIMKDQKLLRNYMALVIYTVDMFHREYKAGKKMLIFSATVKMAEHVYKAIEAAYGKIYNTAVYTAKTKKEVLYSTTIISSTVKSCSTGVDISGLSHAVLTVALSSTQLSRQIMGRLRPLKEKEYGDDEVKFMYLVNLDSPVHLKYDHKRRMDLMKSCKRIRAINTNFIV